jgi:AraC-like DNA-binding protein
MTRAAGMGPLPRLLEAREGPKAVGRVFSDAGLPVALVSERHHLIPLRALVTLFERAARATGDPAFGLGVGLAMDPGEYGMWIRYGMQAPTLGQAIARLARFLVLHQLGGELRVEPRPGGRVAWIYRHPLMLGTRLSHHSDHVVPVMIRLARHYLGDTWQPEKVEVDYPSSPLVSAREDKIAVQWVAGRKGAGLVFPKELLQAPLRTPESVAPVGGCITSLEVLADHWNSHAEDLSVAVDAVVALRLLEGATDMDGAAALMGMGRRSLQRRLSQKGLTYRGIVDRIRMRRARALIVETPMSLTHIAFDLGYSDLAHFSRAFSRHFGHPPSRFRTCH